MAARFIWDKNNLKLRIERRFFSVGDRRHRSLSDDDWTEMMTTGATRCSQACRSLSSLRTSPTYNYNFTSPPFLHSLINCILVFGSPNKIRLTSDFNTCHSIDKFDDSFSNSIRKRIYSKQIYVLIIYLSLFDAICQL